MTITLTAAGLRKAFPNAKMEYVNALIEHVQIMESHGILEIDKRLRHFLAQGAAETSGYTITEESGFYSAEGLLKTFPKYFKSKAEAKAYAKRPQAIFNRTYGNRLGNTAPGDGYKYRGRGIFQLTGKDAYKRYGERLGIDLVNSPDEAATPEISVKIACLYWSDLGLNDWADKDDLLAVSRGINGGNPKRNIQPNGMSHRKSWYAKVTKTFSFGVAAAEAPRAEPGTLQEGDEGPEVEKLQSLLRAKGYPAGNIDGIYGANTRRAVSLFQADQGSDGQAGVWKTDYWQALEAAPNVQEAREAVTAKDLANDPIVRQATLWQRLLLWFGIGGALTGGASEGASNFPALVTQYQPILETLRPPIQWAANNGWVLVVLLCIAGFIGLKYLIQHIVKAYKYGDYQGQYKEVK
jgi:putative chitinase